MTTATGAANHLHRVVHALRKLPIVIMLVYLKMSTRMVVSTETAEIQKEPVVVSLALAA
jgi:ABC-type methionine transport system permease subunit